MSKSLSSLTRVETTAAGGGTTPNAAAELRSLQSKTGLLRGWRAKRAESAAAGDALQQLQLEQVAAESRVALTTMRLAETKVRTALVAQAMPMIGALTVQLNSATASVDGALTSTSMAATMSALTRRSQSKNAIEQLVSAGNVTGEEAQALYALSQEDATDDIQRARARVADAKASVDQLHGYAMRTVASAKDGLE